MTTLRDKVKDAISATLGDHNINDCDDYPELMYDIADNIFDALGISVKDQDLTKFKIIVEKGGI